MRGRERERRRERQDTKGDTIVKHDMVTGRTQHSEKREGLGRQINTIDGENME